jgi:hypothetical protein
MTRAASPPEAHHLRGSPHRTWRWPSPWLLGAIIVVSLLLTGLTWSPSFRAQFDESVRRKPSSYTELYFSEPTKLPEVVEAAQPRTFRFVIANHEGAPQDYSYVVTEGTPSRSAVIDHDTVRVDDSARTTRSVVFVPRERGPGHVVSVRLLQRPQAIHFLTEVQ